MRALQGYIEMQKHGAESAPIPWTPAEKTIVQVAVELYGSNHANTIFEVYSTRLHPERTHQQLQAYLNT